MVNIVSKADVVQTAAVIKGLDPAQVGGVRFTADDIFLQTAEGEIRVECSALPASMQVKDTESSIVDRVLQIDESEFKVENGKLE